MRRLLLAILALLVVAAVVAWQFPASLALRLAGDGLAPLELSGVTGTMWRGQALEARVLGQPLGPISWQLDPAAALAGRTDARLRLDGERYRGSGRIVRDGDRLLAENLVLTLPAEVLAPLLDVPALRLRGEVQLDLARAEFLGGAPMLLEGEAAWRNAAVSGAAVAEFGELVANFEGSASGGFRGRFDDRGGPLDLEGGFEAGITGYQARARLAARPGHPQVDEALQWLGQRQADGSVLLEVRGGLIGGGM